MDSCCFNRPFDDLSQDKVRIECEAVLTIMGNYTEEREEALKDVSIDDIVSSIKQRKTQTESELQRPPLRRLRSVRNSSQNRRRLKTFGQNGKPG